MRFRPTRRELLLAGPFSLTVLIAACGFGPVVRAITRAEAARRHVDIEVGGDSPGCFAIRFLGVGGRPEAVAGLHIEVEDVRIDLSVWLRPTQLGLHGVRIQATGPADQLRNDLTAWRALRR